jgi:arylsulfatase A-like enzyme
MKSVALPLASVALVVLVSLVFSGCMPRDTVRDTVQDTVRDTDAPAAKPNIVFVLTDDQYPGTENAMPSLRNNITSKGLKFANMTSTFPLCCPGRATILRGQYAHNTRILSNAPPLGGWKKFHRRGEDKSTIATWLNSAGYQTGLFGKYMNNYAGSGIPTGMGPLVRLGRSKYGLVVGERPRQPPPA